MSNFAASARLLLRPLDGETPSKHVVESLSLDGIHVTVTRDPGSVFHVAWFGDVLKEAAIFHFDKWKEKLFADKAFIAYLKERVL